MNVAEEHPPGLRRISLLNSLEKRDQLHHSSKKGCVVIRENHQDELLTVVHVNVVLLNQVLNALLRVEGLEVRG